MTLKKSAMAMAAFTAAMMLAAPGHAESVVGLTATNALVTFDSATPLNASAPVTITGLQAGEQILGIDMRPATGALYGLGSSGRLYTLNTGTGAATFVSLLSGASLSGTRFGIDFNPVVDRLRVVSNTGQNLRIDVTTGIVATDSPINGATTSSIAGTAYTNNFAGAATTLLYDISAVTDTLYNQAPANSGTLITIGSLGLDTTGSVGFDISGLSGVAFASLTDGDTGKSSFYTISLSTGAATLVGAFGIGGSAVIASALRDIAVTAVPEPGTWALMVGGLLAVASLARRRR